MALSNGPNLGILVDGGIGEVHYDALMQQWRAMDALIQPRVKSATITTPPASPSDGDCYIVPSGATGGWSGNTNKIARYSSKESIWEYYTPKDGWMVQVESSSPGFLKFNGTTWVDPINTWWNSVTDINGKNIGETTAGTGRFTTLTTTGNATVTGDLLVGSATKLPTSISSSTLFAGLQNHGADAGTASMLQARWSNDVNPSHLQLAKSRGSAVGTHTIVAQNDFVGGLSFAGSDGSKFVEAARISCDVNGVPALGGMPGALRLMTTPAGSDTPLTRVMLTSTGVVDVLSGQIKFPAAQNASADANTLDDYEEGSFTPVVAGTTTAGTGTYTTQVGRYTKIGNRVFYTVALTWTAHTGTGNIKITGLPFMPVVSTVAYTTPTAIDMTYSGTMVAYPSPGATEISIASATSGSGLIGVPMDSSAGLRISGHYEV